MTIKEDFEMTREILEEKLGEEGIRKLELMARRKNLQEVMKAEEDRRASTYNMEAWFQRYENLCREDNALSEEIKSIDVEVSDYTSIFAVYKRLEYKYKKEELEMVHSVMEGANKLAEAGD